MDWADAGTFSGPDEDETFDGDDEFVFMARHLGDKYDGNSPLPPDLLPLVLSLVIFIVDVKSTE